MVIWIGTFFQMVIMLSEDVARVPMPQVETARTLGATGREIVVLVLLRSAMPAMFDTLRITLGWAWTYLVVAELVAANSGLGYAILKAQRFLQTDRIFVGIIVIGLIGLAIDQALRLMHRRLFPWAGDAIDMSTKTHGEALSKRFATRPAVRRALRIFPSASRRASSWRCVGASGCGKSTLLRIIAGLEPAEQRRSIRSTSGRSRVRTRIARWCSRTTVCIPGSPCWQNIALQPAPARESPRRSRGGAQCGRARGAIADRVDGARRVSSDVHPHALSGGMRQRVAIARALLGAAGSCC